MSKRMAGEARVRQRDCDRLKSNLHFRVQLIRTSSSESVRRGEKRARREAGGLVSNAQEPRVVSLCVKPKIRSRGAKARPYGVSALLKVELPSMAASHK